MNRNGKLKSNLALSLALTILIGSMAPTLALATGNTVDTVGVNREGKGESTKGEPTEGELTGAETLSEESVITVNYDGGMIELDLGENFETIKNLTEIEGEDLEIIKSHLPISVVVNPKLETVTLEEDSGEYSLDFGDDLRDRDFNVSNLKFNLFVLGEESEDKELIELLEDVEVADLNIKISEIFDAVGELTQEEFLRLESNYQVEVIESALKKSIANVLEIPENRFKFLEGYNLAEEILKVTDKITFSDEELDLIVDLDIASNIIDVELHFKEVRYGKVENIIEDGEPKIEVIEIESLELDGDTYKDQVLVLKEIKDLMSGAENPKEFKDLVNGYSIYKEKPENVSSVEIKRNDEDLYQIDLFLIGDDEDLNELTEEEEKLNKPILKAFENFETLINSKDSTLDQIEESLELIEDLIEEADGLLPKGLISSHKLSLLGDIRHFEVLKEVIEVIESEDLATSKFEKLEEAVKELLVKDEEGNELEIELSPRVTEHTIQAYLDSQFIEELFKEELTKFLENPKSNGRVDLEIDRIEKELAEKYGVGTTAPIKEQADRFEKMVTDYLINNEKGSKLPEDFWDDLPALELEGEGGGDEDEELPPHIIWEVNVHDLKVFEKLVKGIRVEFKGKKSEVTFKDFPKEGYVAEVTIKDEKTGKVLIDKIATLGDPVSFTPEKDTEKVLVTTTLSKFYDNKRGKEVGTDANREFTATDLNAPVLNYAYVIEKGLVLNLTDDTEMHKKTPVLYRFKGERKFRELDENFGYGKQLGKPDKDEEDGPNYDDLFGESLGKDNFDPYVRLSENDYRIELDDIPTTVQIVALDAYDNKTALEIEIKEDNIVLTKDAPKEINKLVEDFNEAKYKNRVFDDLAQTEVNKQFNILNAFEKLIVNEFRNVNTKDLIYYLEDGESIKETHKFEEAGMYKIIINSKRDFGEVEAWVSVTDKGTVVPNYKVAKELEIEGKDFQPLQAVETPNEKLIPMQVIAIFGNRYYQLTDTIEYPEVQIDRETGEEEEVESIRISLVDLNSDERYRVDVTQAEGILDGFEDFEDFFPEEGTSMLPEDVMEHWSRQHVMNILEKGYMYGYEDGTFGPDNMITAREVLAVVGRIGMKMPQIAAKDVEEREYGNTEGWGQTVVESALNKMPKNIFAGKDLDDPMYREDAAYVLAHFFKIKDRGYQAQLNDLDSSMYAREIQTLISTGAVAGNPDGNFYPNLEVSRAEVAKMLDVLLGQ